MNHHNAKSFAVSDAIMDAASSAIKAELIYQRATNCGRKFGITGEIGEILVCQALGLKMVEDPRSEGFDAIDADGKCVQIKTRRGENTELPKESGRLSRFSSHECDYVLLGILSKDYKLASIWKANLSRLKPIIDKHKRANPTIRQFKSIAEQIYPISESEKIAILGWGSLISKRNGDATIGQVPLQIAENFRPGGPLLPIEFSRISKDGRLTLVIDLVHGKSCETLFAISAASDLNAAIQNLAAREGTSMDFIHFALSGQSYNDKIKDTVAEWCKKNGMAAAVWTGLPTKFHFQGSAFSVAAAVSYLNSLSGTQRLKALDYINTAPNTINTPVREAVASLIAE